MSRKGEFFERIHLIPRRTDNRPGRIRGDAYIPPFMGILGDLRIEQEYAWLNHGVERSLRQHSSDETEGRIFTYRAIPSTITRRVEIHPYFRESEQIHLQISLPFPHQRSEDHMLTPHSAALVLGYDKNGSLVMGIAQPELPTSIPLSDYLTEVDKRKGITLDKAIANNLQSLIPLIATADRSDVDKEREIHHESFKMLQSSMGQNPNPLRESSENVDERAHRAYDKTSEVLRDVISGLHLGYSSPFSILESSGFVDAVSESVLVDMLTFREGDDFTNLVKKDIQSQLEKFIKYKYYKPGRYPRDILKFERDPQDGDRFLCSLESRAMNPRAESGFDTEVQESQTQVRVGYDEPILHQGVEYIFQKSPDGDVLVCRPQTAEAIRRKNHGWRAVFSSQVPLEAVDGLLNSNTTLRRVRKIVEQDLGAKIS